MSTPRTPGWRPCGPRPSGSATAYADVRAGGTHQARLERDIAWNVTQRRLADLDIGESPLVFGRLDMEDRSRWYVGRLAVEDEEHTPLVVDWRAPVAEPFYRATAVEPMAVVRRRHLISRKGRELVGPRRRGVRPAGGRRGGAPGRGRGRAARRARAQPHRPHGRHRRHDPGRTGRSDPRRGRRRRSSSRAVRAPARPRSRCTAPRTCSTRTGAGSATQGVLLVGPSPVFLRYIEHVLPSLGEQDVQLSTIAGLRPQRAACAAPIPTRPRR